ncbi:MAG: DUF3426 domain-containing protein [Pseudomonadota bacterium]
MAVETPVAEPFLEVSPRSLHMEDVPEEHAPPATTLRAQRENLGRGDESGRAVKKVKKEPRTEAPAQIAEEEPQHSFMRKGRSYSAWSRPWARAVLASGCLVLTGGLVLQVVVQERDRIAATEPSTRRFLEPLCEALRCTIAPLRQIESIVIDSSAFAKVRSDVYRLSFTLKNSAQIAVATPSLELTLTDMQDQAVVRRVFSVADFGKQALVMEPGAELPATLAVSVKHGTNHEKISGYRLLSFYP